MVAYCRFAVIAVWALGEMLRWRICHNRLKRELERLSASEADLKPDNAADARGPSVSAILLARKLARKDDEGRRLEECLIEG